MTILPLDVEAMAAATARQARLTKPAGALGQLETLSIQLAGITGVCPPVVPSRPAIAVFAGDHGVVRSGVTPWPQEVTAQMVANFAAGGAAVSVLARRAEARLVVVDVGVAHPVVDDPIVWQRRVRSGTADLAHGAAMTVDEAQAAIEVGRSVARQLVKDGADLIAVGDMGIGNTTPSAALISAFTGRSAGECTGRGTGIDDATLTIKTAIVAAAVGHVGGLSPLAVLAAIGGLEIAAIAGCCIEAALLGVPVVVDGVITLAALLTAEQLAPGVAARCIAAHRSVEPGASIALEALGLEPLIDLGLRLGEGSGAALAIPIVQAAAALLAEMATFPEAGVTES